MEIRQFPFGGADRDQTDDLVVANDALSQLSYSPTAAGDTLSSLSEEEGSGVGELLSLASSVSPNSTLAGSICLHLGDSILEFHFGRPQGTPLETLLHRFETT